MNTILRSCALFVSVALPAALLHGQPQTSGTPGPNQSAAEKYFTDTLLLDQDGKEHRFYTDLVKGKVVVISPMFATCKDSCPVMAANLARIQKWLGPRLGNEVLLLSISVDPETDTSPVLKQYAARFNAQPGWYFLTGKKDNVESILKKLGLYVEQKQDHLSLFLIGNDRTGLWKKALGVSDSAKLIEVVQSVLQDKQ